MINQKYKNILFFGALAALICFIILYKINDATGPWFGGQPAAENQTPKKLEDLSIDQLRINEAQKLESESSTENKGLGTAAEAFKKCFKKEWPDQGLNGAFRIAENYRDFSEPMLVEENFELKSSDNQTIVVQHIPNEENQEQVRVFKINPEDKLPDRIKDFPQMSAKTSDRLAGALTLGNLIKKTVTTNQTAYDGTLLSIDKENNQITRFHLVSRDFDFECKNEKCVCLTK